MESWLLPARRGRRRSNRSAPHPRTLMKLALFALLLGISIGYFYGYDDARHHTKNVVERTVDRVGGKNRDRMSNDIDKQTDSVRD